MVSVRLFMACAALLIAAIGAAAEPSALVGKEWRVHFLAGEPVGPGLEVTITFLPDGRVAGRSACNRYTGSVTLERETVRFGPIAGTRMACPPPAMTIEATYLGLLQQAERWSTPTPERLVITTRDGKLIEAVR